MKKTLTDYERGEWDMFFLITSAEYGKGCYFLQNDNETVYSRRTHKYMKRQDAFNEYLDTLNGDV